MITISNNAVESVVATLANPGKLSDSEDKTYVAFKEMLSKCVRSDSHIQKSSEFVGLRLYTVTTIAPLPRYGGKRTPVICTSFNMARRYVEENLGDIYECSYSLAVIEAVAADRIYIHFDEAYWYMWLGEGHDGKYVPIEPPVDFVDQSMQPLG